MGMSASQARLLTITGRLTDNELRSQTITNSKLRLAQKSSEASQAYMDALNTEKLTYKYYNDNGESASYNLTPALIYSYEPLKKSIFNPKRIGSKPSQCNRCKKL
jgi:outer membrane PBP1 activator LpoA protein